MIFPGIEGIFAWMERENKLEDNAQKSFSENVESMYFILVVGPFESIPFSPSPL